MKTDKDIDKLFHKGTQKDYPYDENLWAQVESELPNSNEKLAEKSQWIKSIKLLIILAFILFLETDSIVSFNQYVPRQINAYSDISSASTSDEKLALQTVEAEAPKTAQVETENTIEKNKKSNSAQKLDNERQSATSAIIDEKHLAEKNNRSSKTVVTQQTPSNPIETGEKEVLAQVKEEEFKPESNVEVALQSSNSKTESPLPAIGKINLLSSLDFLMKSNYTTPLPQEIEQERLNKMQQKFKKRDYFIELEYGRSVLIKKQLSGLDAMLNDYRKEAENSRYQQSMGLNLLTNVKRFTVGIGFHISSFHEQLNYSYHEEINSISVSYDTTYTVINGNFNSNGTPVILINENINENRKEVSENVNRELIINNHFKRISLPLSLGYNKTFGRFNVGLRTSFVLNYLYASSGGYISDNRDHFYGFEENKQLEDWVIGNRNQLRLGYSLNEFVAIGTSLNHEQDLGSFTQDYSSRFNTYGMGMWLLYRPK